ncbi:hypothetical protein [Shewanella surugensis]|uniref:DUF2913 family protein n=1 Tax=Shewanella surugensis TaxID=212020 RepID=A0ABT0LB89_9GAMM|nr:hypothetical protein [Shewanella surugensis]MCL1124969.1 hypothetical protein [Shewanella surugensis]
MIEIPKYLSLLDTIKQLFQNEKTEKTDKNDLLNWAKKIALLQLQVTSQSVSQILVNSLIHDSTQIMAINIKRHNQLNSSNEAERQHLNQFHLLIEHFYQALNQLSPTYTDEDISQQWMITSQSERKIPPVEAISDTTSSDAAIEKNRQADTSELDHCHSQEEMTITANSSITPSSTASKRLQPMSSDESQQSFITENNTTQASIDSVSNIIYEGTNMNKEQNRKPLNNEKPYSQKDSSFLKQLFDDKEE